MRPPRSSTPFPYTTLFRSLDRDAPRVFRLSRVTGTVRPTGEAASFEVRSEEHTSELQSGGHLVCRRLLEKKKQHLPLRRPARNSAGRRGGRPLLLPRGRQR